MKIPTNLKHRPIFYESREDDSDAKFFSIGQASWNANDFSVKVFRHTGKRWSRQGEEIPLERFVDLFCFFVKIMNTDRDKLKGIPCVQPENTAIKIKLFGKLSDLKSRASMQKIREIVRK